MKELRCINLFRATAAYWVLIEHCKIWGGWQEFWIPQAKMAVDLFMVISGFLMAAHAIDRASKEPLSGDSNWRRNWRRFWVRRFFRIAPAYYLALALVALTSTSFLRGFQVWRALASNQWAWDFLRIYDPTRIKYTAENLMWHVSFLFGLDPEWSFSTFLPDWSLSLEMQFYLVFPALWAAVNRWGALLTLASIGLPVYVLGQWLSGQVHYYEPALLVFGMNYFLAGMAACCALRLQLGRKSKQALAISAVTLASLGIVHAHQMLLLSTLVALLMLLAWLEECRRLPASLAALLDSKFIHVASESSYSVYLFHGVFIAAAGCWVGAHPYLQTMSGRERTLMLIPFVTICTFALAQLVRRYVEQPGIELGRRVLNKRARSRPHPESGFEST